MKKVISTSVMIGALCISMMSQALPIYHGEAGADFNHQTGRVGGDPAGSYIVSNTIHDPWSERRTVSDFRVTVPEPSTLALLGLGLIWVGARKLISRKKK
ncbi:MAG: PEP-CTERM sorting domain-containing protein [Candidatus Thiodiazotropha lotti]|uniref:Ice-binding protein C-terminal domain-containing protein n=1 Tax=Candidatus Thiodiazotropha endoloripes TaxID=1818881 RepID=A0A1E2UN10_9GAMM|nr:PEP-CTERM sorting domain-containing protein [Candidatus Thiodiazotropha endoloripes]MCG7897191.1 PEP-CTERM sorting domain-containing protein [Candidatus Thiodiazotropha weberae]MCG7991515.1 PEP-CTERM sorting domain-containing protein [Candidatus Thiodiazotropha lotti]MCG7902241.1 PEP-CTERM sorting domain-containing protein [Candidatus Thiodiazotropha weberae]MCG7912704.1 PEP-CTERM sorting domain-containing protein [Candidatus Thiodiazotropha weberae]MCG7999539.1 PEP-CTERM sorting domain-con